MQITVVEVTDQFCQSLSNIDIIEQMFMYNGFFLAAVLNSGDGLSVCSDTSDDYLVVPMPPCFDPDLPLNTEPANIGVSRHNLRSLADNLPSVFTHIDESRVYITPCSSTPLGTRCSASASDTESVMSEQTGVRTDSEITSCAESESLASLSTEAPVPIPVNLLGQVSSMPLEPVRASTPMSVDQATLTEESVEISAVNELHVLETPVVTDFSINVSQHSDGDMSPIATQPHPISSNDIPIATQPEPSSPPANEENRPADHPRTVSSSITSKRSPDFVSEVVTGALVTAVDAASAAANAGRVAFSTIEKVLFSPGNDQPTAHYRPADQECDVTLPANRSAPVSFCAESTLTVL